MLDQFPEVTDVAPDERFIRLPEVMRITAKSRTSIFLSIRRGEFPPSIAIGSRSRAWLESRVRKWMVERINAKRTAALVKSSCDSSSFWNPASRAQRPK